MRSVQKQQPLQYILRWGGWHVQTGTARRGASCEFRHLNLCRWISGTGSEPWQQTENSQTRRMQTQACGAEPHHEPPRAYSGFPKYQRACPKLPSKIAVHPVPTMGPNQLQKNGPARKGKPTSSAKQWARTHRGALPTPSQRRLILAHANWDLDDM